MNEAQQQAIRNRQRAAVAALERATRDAEPAAPAKPPVAAVKPGLTEAKSSRKVRPSPNCPPPVNGESVSNT